MSVHKMTFVLVSDMAPRMPSVCTECSQPLERGYLHDLSTSRRYCGIECYPRWMVVGGFVSDRSLQRSCPVLFCSESWALQRGADNASSSL